MSKAKSIDAVPLWWTSTAPGKHQSHLMFSVPSGGAVCGADLHGEAVALRRPAKKHPRCTACLRWLNNRRTYGVPGVAARALIFSEDLP